MNVIDPMRRKSVVVTSPIEILERMAELAQNNSADVAEWGSLSLDQFFDLVKRGTYNREPTRWSAQVVARPRDSISKAVPIAACANKAIILSAWAELHRIPWRLVAVGRVIGRPPHHVYPEFFIGGFWRTIDATYPWSVLFASRPYPVRVEYTPHVKAAA